MFKMKILSLVAISFSLCYTSCVSSQVQGITDLESKSFAEAIDKSSSFTLLDVRTEEEHVSGHIPNSLNMDFYSEDFKKQVTTLDTNLPVYVYCRSGGRSAKAAAILAEEGYTVYNLLGGMMKWSSENRPSNKGKESSPE